MQTKILNALKNAVVPALIPAFIAAAVLFLRSIADSLETTTNDKKE